MKLNLGCGHLKFPGWVNVDIRPEVKPDVVGDAVAYVKTLADNSVAAVEAAHFLEHIPWPEAKELIPLIYRKLRPGCWVALETPDLFKCLKQLEVNPASVGVVANIFGHHAVKGEIEHRWAYTGALIAKMLKAAGFQDVREDQAQLRHPKLGRARDVRVIGRKPA